MSISILHTILYCEVHELYICIEYIMYCESSNSNDYDHNNSDDNGNNYRL